MELVGRRILGCSVLVVMVSCASVAPHELQENAISGEVTNVRRKNNFEGRHEGRAAYNDLVNGSQNSNRILCLRTLAQQVVYNYALFMKAAEKTNTVQSFSPVDKPQPPMTFVAVPCMEKVHPALMYVLGPSIEFVRRFKQKSFVGRTTSAKVSAHIEKYIAEKYEEINRAMAGQTEGSINYAEAVKALQDAAAKARSQTTTSAETYEAGGGNSNTQQVSRTI